MPFYGVSPKNATAATADNDDSIKPKRDKMELGETPRRLVRKRCRYSSLEKFEYTA